MNSFNLAYTLEIGDREIIAAYGGGGKTTLLGRLARELSGTGRKVLLTTTTKIFRPDNIPVVVTPSLKEAMVQIRKLFDQHSIVVLGALRWPIIKSRVSRQNGWRSSLLLFLIS